MASNFFKVDKGVTLAPQSSVASPQNGDVYYDSTRNTYVFRNNGASVDLQSRSDVGTASSLTSANFTATVIQSNLIKLTGSTVSNIHGITASSDAKMIVLYNGSSAVVTIKNASGTEATAGNRILTSTGADVNLNAGEAVQLTYDSTQARWIVVSTPGGSANGGTGKNYLTTYKNNPGNGNFESASTTGWSLGTTGTLTNGLPTGSPTFGSGASGNLSISTVSSGQLAGAHSLSYDSSAATTQGNMLASDTFTIDLQDQAKVLTWRFYYRAQTNANNANWSGTSSNSFGVAVWDVTNSTWLPTTASFGMTQSSGVGIVSGTVQTASNAAQLRLVVYNVNATTGAITLYFDDFSFGPQTSPIGSVSTDWVTYVPTITGFGTPTGVEFSSRRVADTLEIQGTFVSGTSTAVLAQITLGFNGVNGNVIGANNKIIVGGQVAGAGFFSVAGAATFVPIALPGVNYIGLGLQTATQAGFAGANGNTIMSSGQRVSFFAAVPIQGWSSNVQVSNDTDTRVVGFYGKSTATTAFTNTEITLGFTAATDTHASWSTNLYTVPVSGIYDIKAILPVFYQGATANSFAKIYINGSLYTQTYFATNVAGAVGIPSVEASIALSAGATIQIRLSSSTAGTVSLIGSTVGAEATLTIQRKTGPSVIAATESVNANYSTAAGQSIPFNTATTVIFGTKNFDSHNGMNSATGVYTTPISGKYRIAASLYWSTAITATATDVQALLYKNGSVFQGTNIPKSGTSAGPLSTQGTFLISCNAGDTLEIKALQNNSASTAQTLLSNSIYNWITIERVGN